MFPQIIISQICYMNICKYKTSFVLQHVRDQYAQCFLAIFFSTAAVANTEWTVMQVLVNYWLIMSSVLVTDWLNISPVLVTDWLIISPVLDTDWLIMYPVLVTDWLSPLLVTDWLIVACL